MAKKYMNIDHLDEITSLEFDTTAENKETQTDYVDTKSSENAKRIEAKVLDQQTRQKCVKEMKKFMSRGVAGFLQSL